MARTRDFDPDIVLEKAMHCFRIHGVEHTSISDLVTATGVQRSGLYGYFGSKEALFKQSLALYMKNVVDRNYSIISKAEADLDDVKTYFKNFEQIIADPGSTTGCLMCNTSSSRSPEATFAEDLIEWKFSAIKSYFENAMKNARAKQQIVSSSSEEQLAESLFGSVIALSNLCRSPVARPFAKGYLAELQLKLSKL